MQKNSYFPKINTKKYVQKTLVSSAFFWNQSIATVLPLWPACLSVDLDRKINRISLDSSLFLILFSLGLKFINLKFSKISICKNKYSRNKIFLASKFKYTRKLICLRYAMFLSELPPFSLPSWDNTLLDWINIDTRCYVAQ